MSVPVIDNALRLITEGIKYLTLLLKTSHVRKLRKAVDYGEKYILLTEDLESAPYTEVEKLRSRRQKVRKYFFRYNQG